MTQKKVLENEYTEWAKNLENSKDPEARELAKYLKITGLRYGLSENFNGENQTNPLKGHWGY